MSLVFFLFIYHLEEGTVCANQTNPQKVYGLIYVLFLLTRWLDGLLSSPRLRRAFPGPSLLGDEYKQEGSSMMNSSATLSFSKALKPIKLESFSKTNPCGHDLQEPLPACGALPATGAESQEC